MLPSRDSGCKGTKKKGDYTASAWLFYLALTFFMVISHFFTNVTPHCMPSTFFISEVMVDTVELVDLLPKV